MALLVRERKFCNTAAMLIITNISEAKNIQIIGREIQQLI